MMEVLETKNPSETTKLERGYLKYGNAKYSILEYMREGNSLTSREAFMLMGTTCLNTHISELHLKFGFEIPRKKIEVDTRYGKKVKVTEYRMSNEDCELSDYLLEEKAHAF
jgi:hypothetical protein|tara:strand:- start:157 stop:489 length:333 start_codon:yes stop_codon:yes gene_type:complete